MEREAIVMGKSEGERIAVDERVGGKSLEDSHRRAPATTDVDAHAAMASVGEIGAFTHPPLLQCYADNRHCRIMRLAPDMQQVPVEPHLHITSNFLLCIDKSYRNGTQL